ncbi:MAG: lactonase family protein [Planctomycetales bacterium]|nr:lactonase family protein [Planctomycetales bacterium]
MQRFSVLRPQKWTFLAWAPFAFLFITERMLAEEHDERPPLLAYVGTFSAPLRDMPPTQVDLPPGNGQGIHIFRVARDTGKLTAIGEQVMGTSPSCVVANADGTCLYSANETDRVGRDNHGSVSAFSIDAMTGQLSLLNTVDSGGAGPTYVSIHPTGKYLLVANYFGGSVAVLPILDGGRLGEAVHVHNDAGQLGPTKAVNAPQGSYAFSGHDRTHAHMIQSDPSGLHVLHVDLGLDRIFVWRFDPEQGSLTAAGQPWVSLPAGDGPRHFHFHPNGRWLYSIQEEGSTLVLFDYDAETGKLTPRQTVSSLPPHYTGSNFCSEILVSNDGRFVYAGNRLHDSISIFAVSASGELSFVDDEWTRGNYPRSFSFDPSGSFLYCCNQRADHLTTFRVDRDSGALHFTGEYTPVGNPSAIAFVDLAEKD